MALAIFGCWWLAFRGEKKNQQSRVPTTEGATSYAMKRMLVLTLGLTLLTAASAGTAAAQHHSGIEAVDSERA